MICEKKKKKKEKNIVLQAIIRHSRQSPFARHKNPNENFWLNHSTLKNIQKKKITHIPEIFHLPSATTAARAKSATKGRIWHPTKDSRTTGCCRRASTVRIYTSTSSILSPSRGCTRPRVRS